MWNKSLIVSLFACLLSCLAFWKASQNLSSEKLISSLREQPELVAEITMQGVKKLQQKEEEAESLKKKDKIKELKSELEQVSDDPVAGDQDAKIAIIQFFDYHCGYCRKADQMLDELLKSEKNVRVIFKEYPIFGDLTLARAALAAHKQGKYLSFHRSLMNVQDSLSKDALLDLARSSGLNVAQFSKDFDSQEITDTLKTNLKLGENLGIAGTPSFIIGETFLPGAVDLTTIKKILAEERKKLV